MGSIRKHPAQKLIIGFIFQEEPVLAKAKMRLEKMFGAVDFESDALAFRQTRYYESEMGSPLMRKFISFQKLIPAERLPEIKIATNKIEQRFSQEGKRRINIDPGYLDLSQLILASTKDYSHRVYLGKGIYAEVTLVYERKSFSPWVWAYPDYKMPEYIAIFNQIREIYARQIKNS